eukprot:TRINITY_DN296_c0_g1_i1.p1 TRINITY_DN296_c0_g1~~TRINITY_DN296_c0_g1_i1.p1  ORF type:complete len:627 (-),score=174.31 TRINITY_DN296_c0_g1_i1:21-1901(-)
MHTLIHLTPYLAFCIFSLYGLVDGISYSTDVFVDHVFLESTLFPFSSSGEAGGFGYPVAVYHDIDGNGVPEIIVADSTLDCPGTVLNPPCGAIYVLFLDRNLTVMDLITIQLDLTGGDNFGSSLTTSDIDGDGKLEVLVGANRYINVSVGIDKGAIFILSLNETGHLSHYSTILGGNVGISSSGTFFGSSVVGVDLNKNGFKELIVGAPNINSAYVIFLLKKGSNFAVDTYSTIKYSQLFGDPSPIDFGISVFQIPALSRSNSTIIAVGAPDIDNYMNQPTSGSLFLISLDEKGNPGSFERYPSNTPIIQIDEGHQFGASGVQSLSSNMIFVGRGDIDTGGVYCLSVNEDNLNITNFTMIEGEIGEEFGRTMTEISEEGMWKGTLIVGSKNGIYFLLRQNLTEMESDTDTEGINTVWTSTYDSPSTITAILETTTSDSPQEFNDQTTYNHSVVVITDTTLDQSVIVVGDVNVQNSSLSLFDSLFIQGTVRISEESVVKFSSITAVINAECVVFENGSRVETELSLEEKEQVSRLGEEGLLLINSTCEFELEELEEESECSDGYIQRYRRTSRTQLSVVFESCIPPIYIVLIVSGSVLVVLLALGVVLFHPKVKRAVLPYRDRKKKK